MDNTGLILAEYNNLWQEKIAHKTNLRKLKGYVSYLTSIISGSITVFGLSSSDIFKTLSTAKDSSTLAANITNALNIVSIPAVPVIMLLGSFAINELFQIYVIGNHIGNVERKLNILLGSEVFSWEHKVCPVVYGGKKTQSGSKVINLIAANDGIFFLPFIGILTLLMGKFALKFLYSIDTTVMVLYASFLLFLFYGLARVGLKLIAYVKADSALSKAIFESSNTNVPVEAVVYPSPEALAKDENGEISVLGNDESTRQIPESGNRKKRLRKK